MAERVFEYDYTSVPTIRDFSRSQAFMRALVGPFGSGKSSGCVIDLLRQSQEQAPGPDGVRRTRHVVVRNCFSADTEILTDGGWKLFPALSPEDKVAQLTDAGDLEFVTPSSHYQAPYVGEMIGFENEGVDFLVTPDHRLNVSLRNARAKRWEPYRFRQARECFGKQNMRVKRDAGWVGATDKTPEFFRWLGFWFAEGCAGVYAQGRHQCVITQMHGLETVRQLFQEARLPFTEHERGDGGKNFRVAVTPQTRPLIAELATLGKAISKHVPGWVKAAPAEHLRAFLDGYYLGDGNHATTPHSSRLLYTSSKQLADDFQEIALRAGWVANIRKKASKGAAYCINDVSGVSGADHYGVTLSTVKTEPLLVARGSYRGWYREMYAGKVYCVEVPTHRVYVRRNGVAHWSSQTYSQLQDTTIKTFHDWLPPDIFGTYEKSYHNYTVTAFPGVHMEIMFRALDRPDHVAKLLSAEYTSGWVNEAREVPWSVIDALQGRVGRYPARRDGGATRYGIILDTNPPDTDSAFYRYFEEEKPKNAQVFHQPSGRDPKAENLANLPKDYYQNLAIGKDPDFIKVYIDGLYGYVRDGKPVYPEFNDTIHVGECQPIRGKPIRRGWDFGLTPACSFSQMLPDGRWIVFDELCADSLGIDRFSDTVLHHVSQHYGTWKFEDFGDPAGNQRAQTDEKTCFEILRGKGINIQPGEVSDSARIEAVKKPLNSLVSGKPGFMLHPRCKMLRKGFIGKYRYRRLQGAGERYMDSPEKNEYSHIHDALQYDASRLFGAILRGTNQDMKPIKYPKLGLV